MIVGCMKVRLSIPMAQSLKEKRGVVRRCCERVRNRFKVSVAEVADNDRHNVATIGISVVSNEHGLVNSILDKVLDHIHEDNLGKAEVLESSFEIIHL